MDWETSLLQFILIPFHFVDFSMFSLIGYVFFSNMLSNRSTIFVAWKDCKMCMTYRQGSSHLNLFGGSAIFTLPQTQPY